MTQINDFLVYEIMDVGGHKITGSTIAVVLGILLVTRLLLWLIKKVLFRKRDGGDYDFGNTYAVYQIIKYFAWILAIVLILDSVGVRVTVLIAGSAALLVGVGMGLQQTFNDFVSGIILLSERSIKIGDILEIDGKIVKIQEIGLRTSRGLNRDEISIIIPNSLITTSKVINWSHQDKKTRFSIYVGVAYGSDVDMVVRVLEESVYEHPQISDRYTVEARFVDFGNSSLDFQVLFYSEHVFRIEKVKSEIRKIINRKFRENNITIPFQQMDVHFRSDPPRIFKK